MLMAAEFGKLPCKVLWRLSNKEIPDEDSIAELGLADNTKVTRCFDGACHTVVADLTRQIPGLHFCLHEA